jgi:hypothetical protein
MKIWIQALLISTIFFIAQCSKNEDTSVTPPPTSSFTISNLSYTPSVVRIKMCSTTYTITGTCDFTNASGGIAKIRLSTSIGSDTTIFITGGENQISGSLVGHFTFAMPAEPQTHSFQLWVVDGKGNQSNKLSGSLQVIIDDNATDWNSIQIGTYSTLNRVAWIQSAFITVGNAGVIATSDCATGWTIQNSESNANLRALCWSGTQYVVVGERNAILNSPDRIHWSDHTLQTVDSFYSDLYAIAWNGSRFVAVGERVSATWGSAILTSTDGINWTANTFFLPHVGLSSIAWSGNQFVVVGFALINNLPYAVILTSPDGIEWKERNSAAIPSQLNDVIWTGAEFLAVGGSVCAKSPDGINWSTTVAPTMYQVIFTGKKYVGVGNGVFISNDGIAWTQTKAGNNLLYFLRSIAWSGTGYVAVGNFPNESFVSP